MSVRTPRPGTRGGHSFLLSTVYLPTMAKEDTDLYAGRLKFKKQVALSVPVTPRDGQHKDRTVTYSDALMDFYDDTDGDNWFGNAGWQRPDLIDSSDESTSNVPGSHWKGLRCEQGFVMEVALGDNNLAGSMQRFPSLPSATRVSMVGNALTGSLPDSLSTFSCLTHLILSHNSLDGPLPESLGSTVSLVQLRLDHNSISGELPASVGNLTELVELDLSHNQLTGTIPESFMGLKKCTTMLLGNNKLNMPIKNTLLPVLDALLVFDVSSNGLRGSLNTAEPQAPKKEEPKKEAKGKHAKKGKGGKHDKKHEEKEEEKKEDAPALPPSIVYMPLRLTHLMLAGNHCGRHGERLGQDQLGLGGTLIFLESLPFLKHARLEKNNFEGELSPALSSKCPDLETLTLAWNVHLTGPIPTEWADPETGLKKLSWLTIDNTTIEEPEEEILEMPNLQGSTPAGLLRLSYYNLDPDMDEEDEPEPVEVKKKK